MALSNKQQAFIEHYCICWNQTEAARRAGYSAKTAKQQGYRLFTNSDISAAVQARIAELHMSADEVLKRLADNARGSLKPFVRQEGDVVVVDLTTDEAEANFDRLKKIKSKVRTGTRGDDHYREVETEIEIHDALAAQVHIGRHHALFTDKYQDDSLSDDERVARVAALLDRARARRTGQPDSDGETELPA